MNSFSGFSEESALRHVKRSFRRLLRGGGLVAARMALVGLFVGVVGAVAIEAAGVCCGGCGGGMPASFAAALRVKLVSVATLVFDGLPPCFISCCFQPRGLAPLRFQGLFDGQGGRGLGNFLPNPPECCAMGKAGGGQSIF